MSTDILARNNVSISGQGSQPILFAHGFGCDQAMWRFVAPEFEADYQIIQFDYVGAGGSDIEAYDADRYSTLDGYARDVLEIVRALDLRDIIFVGHSVSSMIGALAAREAPERFAHLIMVGPSACYVDDGEYHGGFSRSDLEGLLDLMDKNYIGWANFLAPVIMKNDDRPGLSDELQESFCSTDPVIARRFAEATFFADNRADLADVPVATLVLQCSEDAIAPETAGAFVHDQLPQSTFRKLDATGHCPHMSHPEETVSAIKDYLAGTYAAA